MAGSTTQGNNTSASVSTKSMIGATQQQDAPSFSPKVTNRAFEKDASLILVGVRGCGKRSLGFIAAAALGRRFVTEDYYFQKSTGLSRQEHLRRHGKDEFHKEETRVSIRMLEENKTNCVIECGLASLTSGVQDHLRQYCRSNPIIHLLRDLQKVKDLLKLDNRALRMLQNVDPSHRRCSNFEYFNIEEDIGEASEEGLSSDRRSPTYSFKLRDSQEDFSNFVRFITGTQAARQAEESPFSLARLPIEQRLFTHCVWTKLSWYVDDRINVSDLEAAGDVIEINVDHWNRQTPVTLSKVVAEIRRKVAIPVMIGCDVETSNLPHTDYCAVLEQGLRLGAEFVSVDMKLGDSDIASLVASKGSTRLIGSYFDTAQQNDWTEKIWTNMCDRAQKLGCEMVRVARLAFSRNDNDALLQFKHTINGMGHLQIPLVAFNTGSLGRTSQIFNNTLTSVTHPSLPDPGNAGEAAFSPQLTSRQAVEALFRSCVLDPLKITILGANVSKSLSPPMHNAAYGLLGIEHRYTTQDITSFDEFESIARKTDFGGAAVVQPWKVELVEKLAALSSHAKAIGAINTLIPLRMDPDGSIPPVSVQAKQRNRAGPVGAWFGDNTDWIGITTCMTRSLSPRNVVQPRKTTALIIGAGGMARAAIYAVLQMGCRNVYVYNRTRTHAEKIAEHLNTSPAVKAVISDHSASMVRVLGSRDEPWPADQLMPTMIISCVTQETIYGRQPANFTLPLAWLGSESGGVVMEMSYVSRDTPLVQQIRKLREDTGKPWVLVNGFETLPEQAIGQFELMTGRKAPRRCIREAIVKAAAEREAQGT